MPRRPAYKDLSLVQLRSFVEVCRLESYAAAARELHLTSPALWEQLRGLESYYDCSLLKRSGNRMLPTPEGRQLLEMAGPLLAGLESTRAVLRQRQGEQPQQIRFVSGLRMLLEEVSLGMAVFRREHPQICLSLSHPGGEDLDEDVERGRADLGLTIEPGPGSTSPSAGVVHEPAYEMDYLLVAPADHPLARKRTLRLHDLVEHPLILGRPEDYARRRVEEVLYREGLLDQLRVAVETSTATLTFSSVRAGMGIGISVGNPQGLLARGLHVRSLSRWFGTARFVFVWKRGALRSPFLTRLTECITSTIREQLPAQQAPRRKKRPASRKARSHSG